MEQSQSQADADLVLAHLLDDYDYDNNDDEISTPPPPPSPGAPLLPYPIANAVSFATRSTSMALRIGTFVGGIGLGAAKVTTLSSLELGRGIIEGIISKTGRNVVARSRSDLAKTDAETILERSLEALHATMSQVVFWTTAGFYLTRSSISNVSTTSQILLSVLDQFFGSTDSSRAIASIITLVRREFQNPATGVPGERVSVTDLVLGTLGLAYLQVWCRKLIREEARRLGQEEVIWDVVVLDGERVDVNHDSFYGTHPGQAQLERASGDYDFSLESSDEDGLHEHQLKQQILRSLPRNADVSISTTTTVNKTVTVEVKGLHKLPPQISLPGLDMVENEIYEPSRPGSPSSEATYKFVYRSVQNRARTHERPQSGQEEERLWSLPGSENEEDDALQIGSSKAVTQEQRAPKVTHKDGVPNITQTRPESLSPVAADPRLSNENTANQKKSRKPLVDERPPSRVTKQARNTKGTKKQDEGEVAGPSAVSKKPGIKGVLKTGSAASSGNLLNNDQPSTSSKAKSAFKPPWGSRKTSQPKAITSAPVKNPAPSRNSLAPPRESPRIAQRGAPNFFTSQDLTDVDGQLHLHDNPSASSLVSASERRRRNSVVSQTESFSMQSSRPGSPSIYRVEQRGPSGGHLAHRWDDAREENSGRGQVRNRSHMSYAPSIQTIRTSTSQTSLILSTYNHKSAYNDSENVDTLRRTGVIDGIFPSFHILRNITRYSRYASAAYGSNFLRYMGISKDMPIMKSADETHTDVRYFTHHTGLSTESVLLSSFVDPQGGSDSTGSTDTGIPLVHTIAVDAESKAVVLACRGTLGFDDVLVDMMCDYDELTWRGKSYKVHKGIHASARRLLYGGDGRVLLTLKEALEEFPDYGLVLCGHSLGGAVTALLGAMLAEPATSGTAFVTSAHQHKRLLTENSGTTASPQICLPSGRPIHVYAYGPPATMSPSFQKATRGLITSTVHGNDLVPYLSLGVLHDMQAVALAFKNDNSEAKAEVRRHIMQGLQSGLADKWYNNAPKAASGEEEQWAFAALKTLRASMMSSKLLPPGEVFSVECSAALRRDAFLRAPEEQIGRPATRIVLKYIRDVETHFREIRFGASMLMDHSPGRYEDALRRLMLGVIGQ
ncbi:sn1-specific diacylglycerol lipase [Microdochium nivale]|nr:sn1-specific diacylglycerol lipase [Microdochium nivale]